MIWLVLALCIAMATIAMVTVGIKLDGHSKSKLPAAESSRLFNPWWWG